MKNILIKLLCVFAFIFCFALNSFAADLGITSVNYDDSSSFLTINSFDNEDYDFSSLPKLFILQEENKAYFDINSAVLKCPVQHLFVNSADIKEIVVSQFSLNPNVVRVVIKYNEGFNPANIQLRKLNNTLFVRFKYPSMTNYYFQHVYSDNKPSELYEGTVIQYPVNVTQNGILSQINSAFNISDGGAPNYTFGKKDLLLQSRFYIDNVDIKNNSIVYTGIGALSLSKPIYLSNPSRVAFDIPNTVVNPVIRNKELKLNDVDSVKVGQFNKNTARIVITCNTPDRFVPVVYGDSQRLVFIDKNNIDATGLYSNKVDLTSANYEKNDENTYSAKLVFNKPVVYGIDRLASSLDLFFLNVDKFAESSIKSVFKDSVFSDIKISPVKGGGIKVTFNLDKVDATDIHAGADGKTLRIKQKLSKLQIPMPKIEPSVVVEPIIVPARKYQDRKYIVIDPGHGGADCGSTRNGIYEKDITLDVSKRVVELLEKKGYIVQMTRTTDETVSLQDRVEFTENIAPDIFVSIHVNSSNIESPNGIETHYYKDNSLHLAKNVHASMLNHINANDRGLFKSKFYVINHTTAPAILVEIGFISNSNERAQLVSESRKQATAKAIAEGIYEFFK